MAPVSKIVSVAAVAIMMAGSGLAAPASVDRRQIGGEATLAYELINNADNGSGYTMENLEDGIANGLNPGSGGNTEYGEYDDGSSAPPAGGSSGGPPPAPKGHVRRQGNKISDGLGPLVGDLGQQDVGDDLQNMGDQEDGTLTEGVADIGTTLGGMEQGVPSEAGYGIGKVAGDLISEGKGGAGGAGAAPAVPRKF